jgi:predicted TIM-barrel fold metal-dependent hydrolase
MEVFGMSVPKIDCYTHIVPPKYWDALQGKVGYETLIEIVGGELRSIEATRTLLDLDERFRIMDKYEGLMQVITPTGPPLDLVTSGQTAVDLARICNDEMADLVARYPDRFAGAVALLPLGDMDAALQEAERAIRDLKFVGILLTTPRFGQSIKITKPLDMPDMLPLYAMMAQADLPIWIHPRREYLTPDYTIEESSKYCLNQCFGWPYETTLAMARLVYGGILARFPGLKFITHHAGAMVPFMADRIEGTCDWYEMSLHVKFTKRFPERPIEYFRLFYNDTAIYGNTSGLMCAYSFFGPDRLLFGTDFPYDAEWGDTYTRKTMEAIEGMDIPGDEKEKILGGNARRILKLDKSGL